MAEHCKRCMVPRAGINFGPKTRDCIRGQDVGEDQAMCHSMRADIAEAALMRLACPEAFTDNRVIPERLFDAIDAKNKAMRAACSVRGPTLVFEKPSTPPRPEAEP
jgi:hypothetical protein